LAALLADYTARLDKTRNEADTRLARACGEFPDAADALTALHAGGHFAQFRQRIARLEAARRAPLLANLVTHIDQRKRADTAGTPASPTDDADAPVDISSLAYFEKIWAELKVEQQLAEALAQAPENAGPLNSHLLALQSLKLMRDLSPGYLKRFVSYVDALLWLDQADNAGKPAPKNAAKSEKDKKRKATPRGKKA
ncbi:DUF2894 domain-containing protein, partial [Zoogloea oryzae]|uniref:DUF2894 domain-containing protein n=1 Tax=Zoogloea oryzae TaxID=310767 RepID=UPI0024E0E6FB